MGMGGGGWAMGDGGRGTGNWDEGGGQVPVPRRRTPHSSPSQVFEPRTRPPSLNEATVYSALSVCTGSIFDARRTICASSVSDLYIDVTTIGLTIMDDPRSQILAGTLDLLILKSLSAGPFHGYGLAQHIKRLSKDALRVEEGSLYPALQRMQAKGWIASEVKKSPTGRTARYYKLTMAGRRQLGEEESAFQRSVAVTVRVLRGAER